MITLGIILLVSGILAATPVLTTAGVILAVVCFMPLDHYGHRTRFGRISDRSGVSWQLNLA